MALADVVIAVLLQYRIRYLENRVNRRHIRIAKLEKTLSERKKNASAV